MNIDYCATILDAAGIDRPDTCQGESLLPILSGASPTDWRDAVYYHYYENSWELQGKGDEAMAEPYEYFTPHRIGPHRGVRTDRYKLIEYYSEDDYWELFDLQADRFRGGVDARVHERLGLAEQPDTVVTFIDVVVAPVEVRGQQTCFQTGWVE